MHHQASIQLAMGYAATGRAAITYGHRATMTILQAIRHETMTSQHPLYATCIAQFVRSASFTSKTIALYQNLDNGKNTSQSNAETIAALNIVTEAVMLAEMIFSPSNTSSYVNHVKWGEVLFDAYLARLHVILPDDRADWGVRKNILYKLFRLEKERMVRVTSKQLADVMRLASLHVMERYHTDIRWNGKSTGTQLNVH